MLVSLKPAYGQPSFARKDRAHETKVALLGSNDPFVFHAL